MLYGIINIICVILPIIGVKQLKRISNKAMYIISALFSIWCSVQFNWIINL